MIRLNITNSIFFFLISLTLYGPKFGAIDTSIFAGYLGLLFIPVINYSRTNIFHIKILIVTSILLAYSFFIYIINSSGSTYFLLKYIKVFLVSLAYPIFIMHFPTDKDAKLKIVCYALFLNCIAIFLEVLFPTIMPFIADIYGFNKTIRGLRVFGLTTGFDSAGFLCIIGMVFSGYLFLKHSRLKWLILALLFFASTFATSRTAMLVSATVFLVVEFHFLKKLKNVRILFALLIIGIQIIGAMYFKTILSETIINNGGTTKIIGNNNRLDKNFSATKPSDFFTDQFFLTDNAAATIFGKSVNPDSDNGYVKTIHFIGFLGLLLTLYMYYVFYQFSKKANPIKKSSKHNTVRIYRKLISILIILNLVFNLKNLYFFGRGHYELILIVIFLSESINFDKIKDENPSAYKIR